MTLFSSDEEASKGARRSYFCAAIERSNLLSRREGGEVGSVTFAGVVDLELGGSKSVQEGLKFWDY